MIYLGRFVPELDVLRLGASGAQVSEVPVGDLLDAGVWFEVVGPLKVALV